MANFGHWKIQSFCISTLEKGTNTCTVDGFHDTFLQNFRWEINVIATYPSFRIGCQEIRVDVKPVIKS